MSGELQPAAEGLDGFVVGASQRRADRPGSPCGRDASSVTAPEQVAGHHELEEHLTGDVELGETLVVSQPLPALGADRPHARRIGGGVFELSRHSVGDVARGGRDLGNLGYALLVRSRHPLVHPAHDGPGEAPVRFEQRPAKTDRAQPHADDIGRISRNSCIALRLASPIESPEVVVGVLHDAGAGRVSAPARA